VNSLERLDPRLLSVALHLGALLLVLIPILVLRSDPVEIVRVTVVETEVPTLSAPTEKIESPSIETSEPVPNEPPAARKVFGLNKNSITAEDSANAGAAVKTGNTLATEVDQTEMRPEDEGALPTPVDEFMVTQMPRLKSEMRIPYPDDARKRGIEGPVVLEILIDAQGKVREARLIESPDSSLGAAALEAIRQFEFVPAKVSNNAVAVRIRYSYRFLLDRN